MATTLFPISEPLLHWYLHYNKANVYKKNGGTEPISRDRVLAYLSGFRGGVGVVWRREFNACKRGAGRKTTMW